MNQKTIRKLLGVLLALAMVVGLVPEMGLTAYAAGGGTEVTQANVICQQYSYMDADYYSGGTFYDTPPADITNIALADAQAFGAAVNCPTTYWVVVYAKDGDNLKWTSNGKTGEQTSTPRSASGRVLSAWCELINDDVFFLPEDPMRGLTFYFSKGLATVSVTGVSLDKTTAQTIEVDGKVSFTATVEPNNATDKTVKWSVGGTDAGAVKLYTNEACTTEVGTAATSTLTVYAKGISAGSATVTATSNANSTKTASCAVTVNAAAPVSTYTITIPATLTVSGSGWNATDGISATGTLATGKKLTVTASSANNWALKSGDNSVGYTLTTAEGGSQTTSWEFTALDGTAQGLGIIVEDYSSKPAGTYQDTVTFTAKVETAKQQHSFTLTGPYTGETLVVEYYEGDTWNDMVAKYPNTLKVYSGYVAFGGDGFIYPKNGRMIPATTKLNPNETYEVQ